MSRDDDWTNEVCNNCRQRRTPEGHDPCIANLPGVLFACCGHGNEEGYIKFEDGRCLRFMPTEVSLDLPSVKVDDIPVYQLGGNRVFNFLKKKVEIKRYSTNVIPRKRTK